MMMCPKCGAEMPDNTCTCSNCGEVLTSISSNTHGGDSIILNMHHTGNITDNALLCMSYLGFLVIVPLMLCKNTELARCKFPERIQKQGLYREKALKRLKTEYFP